VEGVTSNRHLYSDHAVHQLGREQATTAAPPAVVHDHGHVAETARGGTALEDEAIEAEVRELAHARAGETAHASRQITTALWLDQTGRTARADEDDRRPRHAEPELHLRAHGNPLHVVAEHAQQRVVPLVVAVVADTLAEEARRDAEPDLFALDFRHRLA